MQAGSDNPNITVLYGPSRLQFRITILYYKEKQRGNPSHFQKGQDKTFSKIITISCVSEANMEISKGGKVKGLHMQRVHITINVKSLFGLRDYVWTRPMTGQYACINLQFHAPSFSKLDLFQLYWKYWQHSTYTWTCVTRSPDFPLLLLSAWFVAQPQLTWSHLVEKR